MARVETLRATIEIGCLFSRSGSYRLRGETCRDALAIEADAGPSFGSTSIERDPGGDVDRFRPRRAEPPGATRARHIVGRVTSSGRTEVIPELEKVGGTLRPPRPGGGVETFEHVYTHVRPNRRLPSPLRRAFSRFARRGYLVGANRIRDREIGRARPQRGLRPSAADRNGLAGNHRSGGPAHRRLQRGWR